jgi:hypothetical protein
MMGHAKELITIDVYGDNQNIIPEEIPGLLSYMAEVMPKEGTGTEANLLDTVIDVTEYLPKPRDTVASFPIEKNV